MEAQAKFDGQAKMGKHAGDVAIAAAEADRPGAGL